MDWKGHFGGVEVVEVGVAAGSWMGGSRERNFGRGS